MAYEDEDKGNSTAKPQSEQSDNPIPRAIDLKLNLSETSFADSAYRTDTSLKPYNPDELVQKDNGYGIYEEMAKDDQVSVCLELKKELVLAAGYEIVAKSGEDTAQEIKAFLEEALTKDPEIEFDDSLKEMLSCYEFGFSLTEKVFKVREDGKTTLKFLKTRHPVTWLIHTDDKGNVTQYEQRGQKESVFIKPEALIHMTNNPRFGNAYGLSDLRAAYDAWFVKMNIVKFYSIFLEKAASPIPVAKYNKDAPQSAVDAIYNSIRKFQAKTALAIPKDIEVEFLESGNNGEAYQKAINIFNMFIGRSLFVPDLLGFQGSETGGGSYSLGSEQLDVLFKHIQRRRVLLENVVNKHIIEPLVYVNFGEVEDCPQFKLKPIREKEIIELSKIWLDAAKSNIFKPNYEQVNYFNKLTRFPETSQKEWDENEEMAQAAQDAMLNGANGPEGEPSQGQESKEKEAKKPGQKDIGQSGPSQNGSKKDFKSKLPPGNYHRKVNFQKIETSMDAYVNGVKSEAQPVIKKAIADLKKQLKKKRIIETQNLDKVDTLRMKYKPELERVFNKSFSEQFKEAQIIGAGELEGSEVAKKFTTPLLDEDFLEVLRSETWQAIGDWEYQIKKKLRIQLAAAIRDGTPLSTILDGLDAFGAELTDVQIERYARTKFTEVMNRGRHAAFEASGVVAAYQYSAILDMNTTEICASLDGKIFEVGDEPIPPLHFNCRSLLVPITKYEKFEPTDKSEVSAIVDDVEDGGFSWQ
jgi:SPP1 gp7 family putative phage head morphogenesis protein